MIKLNLTSLGRKKKRQSLDNKKTGTRSEDSSNQKVLTVKLLDDNPTTSQTPSKLQTNYPIQKSETNLFFQIYARFFKTNNPADAQIPLRQLLTQEHGGGLWGLISNDNNTYFDETFYL